MRLALFTDAWHPQINGVVRTWSSVIEALPGVRPGLETVVMHPGQFPNMPAPGYPEIRLAAATPGAAGRFIDRHRPAAIHIATEGPIGRAARRVCRTRGLRFTTSFHTQFPEYLRTYYRIPGAVTYGYLRAFHTGASAVLAPTERVSRNLRDKGLKNVVTWRRGVDTRRFTPAAEAPGFRPRFARQPRPICLYVGRVAPEKNLEAFLRADLPGTKAVVGDGPARRDLQSRYPDTVWCGAWSGDDLIDHYRDADVFVFPSRTDTYGVVMLEANAVGLPVAAYPVTGPLDVVKPGETGVLHDDLATATRAALALDSGPCIAHARSQSWHAVAEVLVAHLAWLNP